MESARWAKLPENIAKATPLVIATWQQALCFEMTNGHFSVVQKRILAIYGAEALSRETDSDVRLFGRRASLKNPVFSVALDA